MSTYTGWQWPIPDPHPALAAKASKSSVNYRPGNRSGQHCSICTMWRAGRCTAVAGVIDPNAVCDLFKRIGT